jgi:hypothetical protein
MRRFLCLFVLCAAAVLPAAATVTLTANLKDLGNGSPGQLAGIQLQLAQCPDGFPPHTSAHNTGRKSQLFPANDAGDVVIALDGNDEITCEALGNSRWNVYFVFDGGTQFYGQYNIKLSDGATQNLKNLTPITPPPANLTLDYALRNGDNTFAAATKQDFSGAGQTLPMKAGTVPPATCVALKEMFIDTDAAAGARILKCAADGVSWEGMDDSGVAASIPFSGITSGTNSAAAMHVGTGASLDATGSGTIAATTAVALAANPSNCAAGNSAAGVDASGVAEGCAARAQTLANVANKWLNSYDATTGLFTQTQPAFSNLSGSATKSQLPAATVYTDQANTFGAFLQKFQAGVRFALADPTDGTKLTQFDLSNIGTGVTRTVNIPNANSTTVQSSTAPANQFATSVSAQGVVGYAQPDFSNLSGTATDAQIPNNITITLAATATALAANGGDCGAGQAPIGVDASGAAESCTDYMEEPASSGIVARTAANTSAARTFVAGSTNLAWTNGDGVAGNPSIDVGANVALYNAGDKTWGAGSAFCWTFDAGANTDPTFCPTSGTTPSITTNSVIIAPAGAAAATAYGYTGGTNYGTRFASAQSAWVGVAGGTDIFSVSTTNGVSIAAGAGLRFTTSVASNGDVIMGRQAGATLRFGAVDINGTPVAQTTQVQNAITGTDLPAAAQWRVIAPMGTGAGATGKYVIAGGAKQATGTTAHAQTDLEQWTWGTVADPAQNEVCFLGTHGEQWCRGSMTELLTLSTVGLTTDTTNNLLPVDSIIESVEARVTTTITTTTNWAVGDATTAARFCAANATLTAGTTSSCLKHQQGSVATDAAGPVQSAAAKVRITCTGANPGAGVIRITVFYRRFIAPTS